MLGTVDGFFVEPRRLHRRPIDWLIDEGRGLCILDWGRDPVDLLLGAGHLTADESLQKKLYAVAAKAAAQDVRALFNE